MSFRSISPDSPGAWVAAVAVALVNGMAFGTAYTFGTFFDSMADEFGAERGATALLFGLTLLFFFGFGVVSGPLSDRFGHPRVLMVGGTMFVAGLALTSRVDSLGVGYLTYGVGVGIGAGCFVAPLTALVGQMFVARRTLALGVVATGNGLGTLILTPLADRLIAANGWRSAYLTLAAVGAVVVAVALVAVWVRVVPPPPSTVGAGRRANYSFLSSRAFPALFASALLMSIGLFVAFAFVVPFAKDDGVGASAASRLVAVIGLSSIVGRLLLTNVANRFGAVRVYQLALLVQPIAFAVWLVAGGNYPLLLLFAVILGVAYGGFVAIAPEVAIEKLGLQDLGRKMGILFLSFGIGGLIGPPAAGFLADSTSGRALPVGLIIVILLAALWTTRPLTVRPTPVAAPTQA